MKRKTRALGCAIRDTRDLVVTCLPGPTGMRLRTRYYGKRLRYLGEGVRIEVGVQLVNPEYISIASHSWIDRYAIIMAGAPREGDRRLTRIENPSFDHQEGEVVIGEGCHVAAHAVINGHGGIKIGRNVTVASGATLISLSHHHLNPSDNEDSFPYRFSSMAPETEQSLIAGPIVISDNGGLATNAIMLPGTTIGSESWVGAGSLVTESIPDGWIAWGRPARPMKPRNFDAPGAVVRA